MKFTQDQLLYSASADNMQFYQEISQRAGSRHLCEYYYKLLRLFLCHKSRVLEVDAGMADVSVFLAGKGFDTTALFRDEKLRRLGQARASLEGIPLKAWSARLGDYPESEIFNAVIAKNRVPDIVKSEDLLEMMRAVHAHLLAYGIFVFDFTRIQPLPQATAMIQLAERVTLFKNEQYIHDDRVLISDWHISARNYNLRARSVSKTYEIAEIESLLYKAGFGYARFFDADNSSAHTSLPYPQPHSARVMCVARKVPFDQDGTQRVHAV